MTNSNPIRSKAADARRSTGAGSALGRVAWLLALLGCLIGFTKQAGAQPSLSEYQVKALFLFNFAKYVDWPVEAFARPETPITIGLIGTGSCLESLQKIVEGKRVSNRAIVIQQLEKPEDIVKCQILFISSSEKKRVGEILRDVSDKPVLTVSEVDQFADQGGVIGFVKRDGKVRLEINLNAARQAKLEISSKLLSVADNVIRK
jgi:hypothetical protein